MGDGNPDYNGGWSNELRWNRLSLYALLDRQQGGMLANGTWRHYDLGRTRATMTRSRRMDMKLGELRRMTYLQVTQQSTIRTRATRSCGS